MPDMIVTVSHQLSRDEALRRLQTVIAQTKAQYSDKFNDLNDTWNGYVGTFQISAQNQVVTGTLNVNQSDVKVQATLPFVTWFFKSEIESRLREELTKILT